MISLKAFWLFGFGLCMFCGFNAVARAQEEAGRAALAVARTYSVAVTLREIDSMLPLLHPLQKIRFDGERKLKQVFFDLWQALDEQGMASVGEVFGTPSPVFVDGDTRVVGIPFVRYAKNGTKQWMNYIVTSYDGGRTWFIFDLGCTDDRWITALAPRYRGEPRLVVTNELELRLANLDPGSTWDPARPPRFVAPMPQERRRHPARDNRVYRGNGIVMK